MYHRDLFDELFPEDKIKDDITSECDHDYRYVDGFNTCINCGLVDLYKQSFHELNNVTNKTYHLYHRRSYFKEKLRLLVGYKQSTSRNYHKMINNLKKYHFNSIIDLKKIMKQLKLHKYYKYIYSIYYDIKKIKLIDLSSDDIDFLTSKFLQLENDFKKRYPDKSNLLSYNILLYCLLKKYDYDCFINILLPKNHRKITNHVIELLK
jgi:hypothetical protein